MSGEIASAKAVVIGGELRGGFDETVDVVVVGSGAGGMVAATLMSEAGYRVLATAQK
jgi:monoamine oxidase